MIGGMRLGLWCEVERGGPGLGVWGGLRSPTCKIYVSRSNDFQGPGPARPDCILYERSGCFLHLNIILLFHFIYIYQSIHHRHRHPILPHTHPHPILPHPHPT